jgi:hypothetical protein
MANTANYDWPLPSPKGIQINEVTKIATSLVAIDAKIRSFETSYSNHTHKFADLENRPTTLGGYGITDGMTAQEVAQAIKKAVDDLLSGADTALDTLKELADALGNDPNFAKTVGDALGVRVRVDAATNFNLAQRAQGRSNIDALGTVDRGAAGGVASLDSGGKVPTAQLPALTTTATVGAAIAGANAKSTPDDGDFFTGVAAGGGTTMFKATWANIKAALSAVFIKKAGDILTGSLGGIAATPSEDWLASFWADSAGGSYASVPKRRVPFKAQTTTIGNTYSPVLNATYNTSAWGGVWTQGVINLGTNAQATSYQLIHMHNDGQAQKTWTFDGKNGNFIADGVLFAAGAKFQTNGNIVGTIWQNWGAADAYTAIHARIELRAREFADDRLYQAKVYTEDRAYWRTRDYLLSETVPVGGFAMMRANQLASFPPGSVLAGSLLQWSNSSNVQGGSPGGSWVSCGVGSGNYATVWKRIA